METYRIKAKCYNVHIMEIKSPLTGGKSTYESSISTKRIIDLYKRNTDVARFFTGLDSVSIYRCDDTGYRFYYPLNVAGDGLFYEDLSKEELYYVTRKWEHEVADTYIKAGDTVFEQGCATGAFLTYEKETKNIIAFGSELNEAARSEAEMKGISFTQTKEADVSCSFQVLEHIADVKGFINDAINATKDNGYIIFGVPNNAGFLKDDQYCFLNMPPHHMGLWTAEVFAKLPDYFPLELVTVHTENLQPNHYRSHYQIYFGDKLRPLGIVGRILNKIIFEVFAKPFIANKASSLPGHTIVAVFKKKHE